MECGGLTPLCYRTCLIVAKAASGRRTPKLIVAIIVALFSCSSLFAQEANRNKQTPNAESPSRNYFTDVQLVNQNGEKMRFYSDLLQGKVVVINSFFATCQGSCLPLNRNLEKLQKALGDHMGRDVYFVSISVDPTVDTPPNLKAYAKKLNAGPGWFFLTGDKANVDFALKKLGQFVDDKNDHLNIFIIGNERTGLWKKAFGLAKDEELMKVVESVLNDKPVAKYAHAQKSKTATTKAGHYECPMHPEVKSKKPGRCPKCQMVLRFTEDKPAAEAPSTSTEPGAVSSLRIPDVTVQDQNGKSLNFYTDLVKGKVVAINFIFTTCTTICPPLTATFRRVQQQLAAQKTPVQLISISVDPAVDTPERLNSFAAKFKPDPGWTFVTGSASDINSLLQQLGVAVTNKNDHTPMILIGNEEADYWTRAYGLSSPSSLVNLITEAANKQ